MIDRWQQDGLRVAVYTNRKLLIEQTSRVMAGHGLDFGVRAADWSDDGSHWPVQVCSVQTENARVFKSDKWSLHDADRVIIDEAHLQGGEVVQKILKAHLEGGASYVGVTATPLDIGHLYDHLIVAGTNSELRACGALVKAIHYGCDEPDLSKIGKIKLGQDLTEKQNVKAIMVHGVFGRVLEWFKKLNPDRKPSILFAPGVKESVWFAEQFHAAGISAAHIDGQEVWVDGKIYKSDRSVREEILEKSKNGDVKVICNRFVLREGIDCPWLAHGILATVFGSLQSYLQSGGRLLRAYPGMESVTIQDHGGNWHRHGSLNIDRHWELDHTAHIVAGLREQRLRTKEEQEPCLCPQCGMVLTRSNCPCGYQVDLKNKTRPVIQANGTLKEMKGDIYKPRRISTSIDGPEKWKQMYFRARSKKWDATFQQAFAMFAMENNWGWPNPSWPMMPRESIDQFRKVSEVPKERLT